MLVLPAVHRFDFSHSHRESTWGWHDTNDLVECINNALSERGSTKKVEKKDLFRLYRHLNHTAHPTRYGTVPVFFWVTEGRLTCCNHGTEDPGDLDVDFVPAKWGLAIINSIRYPIRHTISQGARKIGEFMSIDANPTTRPRLM